MFDERKTRNSELLQLLLLDNLYAQSGSEHIIFQGGTALRWIYGGSRFSEDLDLVTDLPRKDVEKILSKTFQKTRTSCIAQFGPGQSEHKVKAERKQVAKVFFIYRPQNQRERIAVKLEFEPLNTGHKPEFQRFILRDLPLVVGLVSSGALILPYSSSIIIAETLAEILSDKIRALYERKYIKGRDFYDIWWINKNLKVTPRWTDVKEKFVMYQVPFVSTRAADYFQKKESKEKITEALKSDLPRFLPQNILAVYQEKEFAEFISTVSQLTSDLSDQGMKQYLDTNYERRKINT